MKKIILATMVILSMSGCAQLETAIKRESDQELISTYNA